MQHFSSIQNGSGKQKFSASPYGGKKQSSFFRPIIQPKLLINQPGDAYEHEADAVAEKVMRMSDSSVLKNNKSFFSPSAIAISKASNTKEEPVEKENKKEESEEQVNYTQARLSFDELPPPNGDVRLNTIGVVRRKCPECEEEEKKIQRKEINSVEPGAGTSAENYISSLNGKGKSLTAGERAFFEPRFNYDFSKVKIHTDADAARSAQSINALAYTSGNDIVFNTNQYSPQTEIGKKLLGHELTHVVQQKADPGQDRRVQRFQIPHGTVTIDERPFIAPTVADLLTTIQNIINRATIRGSGFLNPDRVDMDLLVQLAGGQPVQARIDQSLGTHSVTPQPSLLNYRYLFTCRCGFIDMRHFLQLMYISNFFASITPNAMQANSGATRQGRQHELSSEPESRFGPEDTPSNALGAFTGVQLAVIPQPVDLMNAIRDTLQRCGPVNFSSLSAASRTAIIDYYSAMVPDPAHAGHTMPANPNESALPAVLNVPECGERSFPFTLDESNPNRRTIESTDFGGGSAGLTGDSEIRSFVRTQRAEVLRALPASEKIRFINRLLSGWISDDDVNAVVTICNNAQSPAELSSIAAGVTDAVNGMHSDSQQARVRRAVGL